MATRNDAFPLAWPAGWPRTKYPERSRFGATFATARDELIYELELQDTNSHLKAMNAFYSNLVNASQTMQNSADDAKKTQEQIALLAKNLGNLNSVYGNMLAAMQGRA